MATIYCMNCGAELPEDARFCPECDSPTLLGAGLAEGAGAQSVCPSCMLYNDARAERCVRCGAPLGEAARRANSLIERIASTRERKIAVVGMAGLVLAAVLIGVHLSVNPIGNGEATEQPAQSEPEQVQEVVADKGANPEELGMATPDVRESLSEYTWGELAAIAKELEACSSRDDALKIAREYHLVDESLRMRHDMLNVTIDGHGEVPMRLVDVYHDTLSEGKGKAGLSFVATGVPFTHPMNDEDTDEGGWEASGLRAWLNSEIYESLGTELRTALVKVDKLTNNVGDATDASCVSATSDYLWVPSTVELIGSIGWGWQADAANSDGYNAIANAEGEQYAAFHEEEVVEAGANETLALTTAEGPIVWWTRSCSPTTELTYFRGVNETGDLVNLYIPVRDNGVVFGFCL